MVLTAEYDQRKVNHGLQSMVSTFDYDPRVWPKEGGPWTIVHGIDRQVWSTED